MHGRHRWGGVSVCAPLCQCDRKQFHSAVLHLKASSPVRSQAPKTRKLPGRLGTRRSAPIPCRNARGKAKRPCTWLATYSPPPSSCLSQSQSLNLSPPALSPHRHPRPPSLIETPHCRPPRCRTKHLPSIPTITGYRTVSQGGLRRHTGRVGPAAAYAVPPLRPSLASHRSLKSRSFPSPRRHWWWWLSPAD